VNEKRDEGKEQGIKKKKGCKGGKEGKKGGGER
jgi:hypothetical protein